jgi:alkanesulfonate monooxygenase SsuD/methylene tetrahydromethanopterin reductase-like flavin-dependent oxidoreductase (luciferase family)
MQIGMDSFAAAHDESSHAISPSVRLSNHRASLSGQGVYPRPVQDPLPLWLGVGGTPKSFARAGELGLPLMVAIIGGETRRFRPLVDLYRETGERAGHASRPPATG